MTKTALLIGISEYLVGLNALPSASTDIRALQEVLEDRSIGDFDQVKTLLNPNLEQMQSEIERLFTEAERDDLVLLYFSGHGIKDDAGRLYFATSGTRKSLKDRIVKATMVPASFVHDMMDSCRAKRQGIVLDCCFSGAFDPGLAAKDDGSLDLKTQLGGEGRVVMTSSNHLQLSFGKSESASLSVYTQYLIEGLKTGDADIDKDGYISVQDLHRYVTNKSRENASSMTPKLIPFKDLGADIILAKSFASATYGSSLTKEKLSLKNIKLASANEIGRRDYLPNILDPYETLVQDLADSLADSIITPNAEQLTEEVESEILNIIQDASEANFVLVLKNDVEENLSVIYQSDFADSEETQKLIASLRTTFLPSTSIEAIFNSEHHGIYKRCIVNGEDLCKHFVFVPIVADANIQKFMIVAGLPERSNYLGDAYGKIISSFYANCHRQLESPQLIEAAIIDDLKEAYKFISLPLYNRRFELFCDRLKTMTIYFEPILELDSLSISGWEALARDPNTGKAPVDLFQAAELWGVQFMIELDQYFLQVATQKYQEGRQEIKQNRTQDILPLSVNVYPESLTREAYFHTVEKITQEDGLIPGRKLILEISEKTSLPQYSTDTGSKAAWVGFKDELARYVRELKVRCAIDDFGVEHASVSQLAGLQPPYIKVDREILFHESRDIIISFVHELGNTNTLNPPNVILEGFDQYAPVALGHLQDIGVNYIQGYIVNEAKPKVYRLSEEKRAELKELLAVH
ncbi:MAG: EAL domain-containing protein [Cyanobacteria bacterium J06634_6]